MLETLLTLLLITLTATLLLWRWPTTDDPAGRALQLAGEIRLTQTMAMSRGGNWSLTLLSPNQTQMRDSQNIVQSTGNLGGVQVLTPLAIRFNQDGSPATGAGSYTLSNGQIQRTLTVEPVTGSVWFGE